MEYILTPHSNHRSREIDHPLSKLEYRFSSPLGYETTTSQPYPPSQGGGKNLRKKRFGAAHTSHREPFTF